MSDAIVGVLVEELISFIERETCLLRGVADDMKKLHSMLTTIQAVLEDAESKKRDNKPLENWLAKLKDASFEATDSLKEWENNSSSSCFNLKQLHFRCKIAKKTKKLITRFNDIAEERSKFHLDENVVRTLQLEEYYDIQLDNQRNELIQLRLTLTIASFAIAVETLIAGIFGMNIPCQLYKIHGIFAPIIGGTTAMSFLLFLLLLGYARWKKLLGA